MKKPSLYHIQIVAFFVILPAMASAIELLAANGASATAVILKWFVFFAVGFRLFISGVWQAARPSFTAEKIFEIKDRKTQDIVRELGFANLTFGMLGILSLPFAGFRHTAALTGALYFGLAGIMHCFQKNKNENEWIALFSDLFVVVVIVILETITWVS